MLCQVCKNEFEVNERDKGLYETLGVSEPTFCMKCRLIRRFATRNERSLYRRECGLCKKNILSVYDPKKPFTVYCPACWYGDGWNPIDYGENYDETQSFFRQYQKLIFRTPLSALHQTNFSNSEYSNFGLDFKNCYLVFGGFRNEDVYYSNQSHDVNDSIDVSFGDYLEQSYECWKCSKGYRLMYSSYCEECTDSSFCVDCRACQNCIACVGLRNKQYCIMNEQYSKEEYEKKKKDFALHSFRKLQEFKEQAEQFLISKPRKFARFKNAVACTGDDITSSRDGHASFFLHNAENVTNVFFGIDIKDSGDCCFMGTGGAELLYESMSSYGGYRQVACIRCQYSKDAYYSEECHSCENVFGCVSLRNKSYCILNKQYEPEEYKILVEKIKKNMNDVPYTDTRGRKYVFGDFFPIELSAFAYNETKAQEYFPLTQNEAEKLGYPYETKKNPGHVITWSTNDIPDLLSEAGSDPTTKTIGCAHSGSCEHNCTLAFRLTPHEIEWYKKIGIPLPRMCANCRYAERRMMGNIPLLYKRSCMCGGMISSRGMYTNSANHTHGVNLCPQEFQTTYAPQRKEIIYCEQCYQQEVV